MTIFLIPLVSAFCYRSGGVGRNDRFLPFLEPPTPWANKWWRWGMGVPIALLTGNWWLILTYYAATSGVPYGESSWTAKLFGKYRWFVSGAALGAASLDPINALWCGCLFMGLKFFDTDQAYFEIIVGLCSTLIFIF